MIICGKSMTMAEFRALPRHDDGCANVDGAHVFIGARARVGDGASVGDGAIIPKNAVIQSWRDLLQIGPIGSRHAMLCAASDGKGGVLCATECRGVDKICTLDQFEAAVNAEHGDNEYGQEYREAIARIRVWFGV